MRVARMRDSSTCGSLEYGSPAQAQERNLVPSMPILIGVLNCAVTLNQYVTVTTMTSV